MCAKQIFPANAFTHYLTHKVRCVYIPEVTRQRNRGQSGIYRAHVRVAMAICAGGFKKNQPVAERSSAACHATSVPSQSNVMHLGLGANSDINIFRFRAMRC